MSKNKNQNVAAPAEAAGPVVAKGVVAKGKSITSKRGILSGGAPVGPTDLAGGEEAFKALCKAGYIETDK